MPVKCYEFHRKERNYVHFCGNESRISDLIFENKRCFNENKSLSEENFLQTTVQMRLNNSYKPINSVRFADF